MEDHYQIFRTQREGIAMKELWVKADPWDRELVIAAIEAGADAVIVDTEGVLKTKELGVIKTVSDDGDLRWGRDVVYAEIRNSEDEENIVDWSRDRKVVVSTTDWRIIPLENLVARAKNIFVEVCDKEEARVANGILEKGVDGLVINHRDPLIVREILVECKGTHQPIALESFEVRNVRPVGMGDRVCLDTCTLLGTGQGCLVGNSSRALFLIHAESIAGPYVAPRPFRINAGSVHAYVMTPGGRTRYLSELRTGDEVLGTNHRGETATLVVGRVKIERRPLILIEADSQKGLATVICQNAETIRFVGREGEALSVAGLRPGQIVMGYGEEGGRHFGYSVHENIIEQ